MAAFDHGDAAVAERRFAERLHLAHGERDREEMRAAELGHDFLTNTFVVAGDDAASPAGTIAPGALPAAQRWHDPPKLDAAGGFRHDTRQRRRLLRRTL